MSKDNHHHCFITTAKTGVSQHPHSLAVAMWWPDVRLFIDLLRLPRVWTNTLRCTYHEQAFVQLRMEGCGQASTMVTGQVVPEHVQEALTSMKQVIPVPQSAGPQVAAHKAHCLTQAIVVNSVDGLPD